MCTIKESAIGINKTRLVKTFARKHSQLLRSALWKSSQRRFYTSSAVLATFEFKEKLTDRGRVGGRQGGGRGGQVGVNVGFNSKQRVPPELSDDKTITVSVYCV